MIRKWKTRSLASEFFCLDCTGTLVPVQLSYLLNCILPLQSLEKLIKFKFSDCMKVVKKHLCVFSIVSCMLQTDPFRNGWDLFRDVGQNSPLGSYTLCIHSKPLFSLSLWMLPILKKWQRIYPCVFCENSFFPHHSNTQGIICWWIGTLY